MGAGRTNHGGARSKRGTEVAALFYSLIESAKLLPAGRAWIGSGQPGAGEWVIDEASRLGPPGVAVRRAVHGSR
jgi:hypothetical protein